MFLKESMATKLEHIIKTALNDVKGRNIVAMDVSGVSDFMDTMIIASGTSSRHVKALADGVIDSAKKTGVRPIGIEGLEAADWVLVDYGDLVVHVMLPQTRDFYDLENLWAPMAIDDPDR